MQTYSDEALDYYADRFMALRLARHGITLPQYLASPEECELTALEPEPPLPAQNAVILSIWQQQDTGVMPRQHADPTHSQLFDADDLVDVNELLAGWRAEIDAEEQAIAHLPQRNGAIIEPLAHHRHNRGAHRLSADFSRKHARKGA